MNISKKSIISIFTIALGFCISGEGASAAPYMNKTCNLKQPDNSIVEVKASGDEYYQDIESMDGYTLCRNSDGWICYADLNDDKSEYIPTNIIYDSNKDDISEINETSNIPKHIRVNKKSIKDKSETTKEIINADSEALDNSTLEINNPKSLLRSSLFSLPSSETVTGLTILIDFPDVKSDISKDELENFFNETGYTGFGNNGSVKDFFFDVSGGKLTYINNLIGFYTAKHEKSYYDDYDDNAYEHAHELIDETLVWLVQSGYDFSSISKDENGCVRGLNFLYAGAAECGWSRGLWPHQGSIGYYYHSKDLDIGFKNYEMSDIGSDLSLYTVCHENGHMICGYPDLYDYDGDSAGCGGYDLMAAPMNYKNPSPPDPYLRNIVSNWNDNYDLNGYDDDSTISVISDSTGGNQDVYKWSGSNSKEYYLIENINKQGRYADMPDEGLLIWHIDEDGDNSYNQMSADKHYKVSVVQADNYFDLEKNSTFYGEEGDLFHSGYNAEFNSITKPNSKWWNGTSSELSISDISDIGSTMTFVKCADKSSTDIENPDDDKEDEKTESPKISDDIKVETFNTNKSDITSSAGVAFKVTNTSTEDIDISAIRLRYYYTLDSKISENFWCDWSSAGTDNVWIRATRMIVPQNKADSYFTISFGSESGTLKSGESVIVQVRFAKNDWSSFTQSNDLSFDSSSNSYDVNTNVAAYINGINVWGFDYY